jgi:hypothetical protein
MDVGALAHRLLLLSRLVAGVGAGAGAGAKNQIEMDYSLRLTGETHRRAAEELQASKDKFRFVGEQRIPDLIDGWMWRDSVA